MSGAPVEVRVTCDVTLPFGMDMSTVSVVAGLATNGFHEANVPIRCLRIDVLTPETKP